MEYPQKHVTIYYKFIFLTPIAGIKKDDTIP